MTLKQRVEEYLVNYSDGTGWTWESNNGKVYEEKYTITGTFWYEEDIKPFEGVEVTYVDSYGGMDCGREYWWVWSFSDGSETVYVRFDGWYASHYGSEFEDWFFVEPQQKQVTIYE